MNQQFEAFEQMKKEIEKDLTKQKQEIARNKIAEEKKRKEEQFNQGLEKLVSRIFEYENDKESPTYQLLKAFLDVAVGLQDLMKNLNAINDAMSCLTDAVEFIDCAIDFDNQLLDESLVKKYGPFQRFKNRLKQRKAIKNNVGRIMSLTSSINAKYKWATDLSNSLEKLGGKIKKEAEKNRKKMEKEKLKKGIPVGETATPSRGDEFLEKCRKKNNDTSDSDTSEKPSGGTDQAGSGDISDILN